MKRNNVAISPDPIPETTAGGIIRPAEQRHKTNTGTVVAVGSEVTDVKIGDNVTYQNGGHEIEHEGKPVVVLPEDLILFINKPA